MHWDVVKTPPGLTRGDLPYGLNRDAEPLGDALQCQTILAQAYDLSNLWRGQFGSTVRAARRNVFASAACITPDVRPADAGDNQVHIAARNAIPRRQFVDGLAMRIGVPNLQNLKFRQDGH